MCIYSFFIWFCPLVLKFEFYFWCFALSINPKSCKSAEIKFLSCIVLQEQVVNKSNKDKQEKHKKVAIKSFLECFSLVFNALKASLEHRF